MVGGRLIEREAELAAVATAAKEAAAGAGAVILVHGEAGIGKSSLVEALRAYLPAEARMLVGYCDDLATARTLGPFRDLAGSVGTRLSAALADDERDAVLAALSAELASRKLCTVLVVEDVHWADVATLDTLRYLVRRMDQFPAVLLLTYRDDELGREHPLAQLLAEAARGSRTRHLALRCLSAGAVRDLSAGSMVDASRVFALTAGNPFFVSEVLASADVDSAPPTVVDAVLGRVRRLDGSCQDVLEQLAVIPSALDRRFIDAIVPGCAAELAAAEQCGLLTVWPDRVAFRHELTRRAIADALPVARRVELNRRVLAVLTGRADADLAQLVHHAAEAGDAAAIVRYGPDAARDAARAGAHQEADAHYELVLEHVAEFAPGRRAELLEDYAVECYTIGAASRAVRAQRTAVELRRELGDLRSLGASLRWLSRMLWWDGDRGGAEQAAGQAVDVLERADDRRLLALALSNQSLRCWASSACPAAATPPHMPPGWVRPEI